VKNDHLVIQATFYPESVLFLYKDYQGAYAFGKILICKRKQHLSTKKADVNNYYYIYIKLLYTTKPLFLIPQTRKPQQSKTVQLHQIKASLSNKSPAIKFKELFADQTPKTKSKAQTS
jgi:hypothetical protein